jgi:hypothetical protein
MIYQYDVTLSVKNFGTSDAQGWVKLALREPSNGKVLDIKYVEVSVAAQSSADIQYQVFFRSGLDEADETEVYAETAKAGIPCASCGGTGKVALNYWLLANQLKDSLRETARVNTPYTPPVYVSPDSSGSWEEGAPVAS